MSVSPTTSSTTWCCCGPTAPPPTCWRWWWMVSTWPRPAYGHLPLINGPDGQKLSKRHGALAVEAYRDMGYLPETIRNYLLRLGWSHGDEEIIPTAQAIAS